MGAAASSNWERAFQREMEVMNACLGLEIEEVPADGSCLFAGFAYQVYGDAARAGEIRERCCKFLRENESEFSPFVEEPWQQYCDMMEQPHVWGSDIEVQACARALGVNAVVHVPESYGNPPAPVVPAPSMGKDINKNSAVKPSLFDDEKG